MLGIQGLAGVTLRGEPGDHHTQSIKTCEQGIYSGFGT